jgi:hypothetical protein
MIGLPLTDFGPAPVRSLSQAFSRHNRQLYALSTETTLARNIYDAVPTFPS